MFFALLYAPGSAWLPDTPVFGQSRTAMRALAAHRDYLLKLLKAGQLVLGGPFLDGSGGLAIIEVETEEEARAILAEDPAITSGVFTGVLRPWLKEFDRHAD